MFQKYILALKLRFAKKTTVETLKDYSRLQEIRWRFSQISDRLDQILDEIRSLNPKDISPRRSVLVNETLELQKETDKLFAEAEKIFVKYPKGGSNG